VPGPMQPAGRSGTPLAQRTRVQRSGMHSARVLACARLSPDEVLRLRLANHHLADPAPEDAATLVAHLGAVQAQDYPAAKWALGLRLRGATDALLDAAFDSGQILRTHVLRPTWHFVAPSDIRWLLTLTAPRVKAMMDSYARRLGLDVATFSRSQKVLAQALQGGRALTRAEVGAVLNAAGIAVPDGGVVGQILARAELDALVCSGARMGRQHTYMLLEDRVAPVAALSNAEALAELTWRYFSSHGPATVADCTWWSSLPARDINRGLELNRHRLESERVEGRTYWFAPSVALPMPQTVYLLPNYDEYTVAYRYRDLYYDAARNRTGNSRSEVPFTNVILLQGAVAGRWARRNEQFEYMWTIEPGPAEQAALAAAEQRYRSFLA
jgi:winged helix DNA-binding protein